jgi:hypothetical protein
MSQPAATIRGIFTPGRMIFTVFFWAWGIVGLFINGFSFLGLSGSIGLGTSAYLSASILFWIGGMVLFGLGTLIVPGSMNFERPELPKE